MAKILKKIKEDLAFASLFIPAVLSLGSCANDHQETNENTSSTNIVQTTNDDAVTKTESEFDYSKYEDMLVEMQKTISEMNNILEKLQTESSVDKKTIKNYEKELADAELANVNLQLELTDAKSQNSDYSKKITENIQTITDLQEQITSYVSTQTQNEALIDELQQSNEKTQDFLNGITFNQISDEKIKKFISDAFNQVLEEGNDTQILDNDIDNVYFLGYDFDKSANKIYSVDINYIADTAVDENEIGNDYANLDCIREVRANLSFDREVSVVDAMKGLNADDFNFFFSVTYNSVTYKNTYPLYHTSFSGEIEDYTEIKNDLKKLDFNLNSIGEMNSFDSFEELAMTTAKKTAAKIGIESDIELIDYSINYAETQKKYNGINIGDDYNIAAFSGFVNYSADGKNYWQDFVYYKNGETKVGLEFSDCLYAQVFEYNPSTTYNLSQEEIAKVCSNANIDSLKSATVAELTKGFLYAGDYLYQEQLQDHFNVVYLDNKGSIKNSGIVTPSLFDENGNINTDEIKIYDDSSSWQNIEMITTRYKDGMITSYGKDSSVKKAKILDENLEYESVESIVNDFLKKIYHLDLTYMDVNVKLGDKGAYVKDLDAKAERFNGFVKFKSGDYCYDGFFNFDIETQKVNYALYSYTKDQILPSNQVVDEYINQENEQYSSQHNGNKSALYILGDVSKIEGTYDGENFDETRETVDGKSILYKRYDDFTAFLKIADANGNEITYTDEKIYNSNGEEIGINDIEINTLNTYFTYDEDLKRVKIGDFKEIAKTDELGGKDM